MNNIKQKFLILDYEQMINTLNYHKDKMSEIARYYMIENKIPENKDDFEAKQKIVVDEPEIKSTINEPLESEPIGSESQVEGEHNKTEPEYIESSDKFPSDIQTVYRNIVKKTHPDKISDPSLNDYYKICVDAKSNNDIITLLILAYKLDIDDIYELDNSYFNMVKTKIEDLKNEIKTIENNPLWIWFFTEHDILRNMMKNQIDSFLKKKAE